MLLMMTRARFTGAALAFVFGNNLLKREEKAMGSGKVSPNWKVAR